MTQLLADTGDLTEMREVSSLVAGFTTNPSLIRRSGTSLRYREYAEEVLAVAAGRPVSFEVFADDFAEMEQQALRIADWGSNVFVKIPITDTMGRSTGEVIQRLSERGVQLNVTAILDRSQVESAVVHLNKSVPSLISIFAGRVADTGRDPVPLMETMSVYVQHQAHAQLIWASAREVYNVVQARRCGCPYITLSPALIRKLSLFGRDVLDYSLETVREFYRDGQALGSEVF